MRARWKRLTATRGRAVTFFGSMVLYFAVSVLLPQPFLLGVPAGTYTVLGLLLVWLVSLNLLEARWKRQDEARGELS